MNAWAAAFEAGGLEAAQEAEREELKSIRREKDEADERNFRAFEQMIRQGQAIRRQREEQETRDGTFFPRPGASEFNPFSGERIVDVPEDDSLRLAREARWGTGIAAGVTNMLGDAEDDASDEGSNPATGVTTSGSDTDSTSGESVSNYVYDAQNNASDNESSSSFGIEDEREFSVQLAEAVDAPPPVPAMAAGGAQWTSINIIAEDDVSQSEPAAPTQDASAPPPIPEAFYGEATPPAPPADTSSTDLSELD